MIFKRGLILINILIVGCIFHSLNDVTYFDLPYKIYDKKRFTSGIDEYNYYFYCKHDLGLFKVHVDESTFNSKKINDNVRFNREYSAYEMLKMSRNDATKENIHKHSKKLESFINRNEFIQVLMVVYLILALPFASILSYITFFKKNN